jgi:hypothetical protein
MGMPRARTAISGAIALVALRREEARGPAGMRRGGQPPAPTCGGGQWTRGAPCPGTACRGVPPGPMPASVWWASAEGAFPWCAQAGGGGTHRPAWHGVTHRAGGRVLRAVGAGGVAVRPGHGDPELGDEGGGSTWEGRRQRVVGLGRSCGPRGGWRYGRSRARGGHGDAVHRGAACAWRGGAGVIRMKLSIDHSRKRLGFA